MSAFTSKFADELIANAAYIGTPILSLSLSSLSTVAYQKSISFFSLEDQQLWMKSTKS
jgi:hypothetical protein